VNTAPHKSVNTSINAKQGSLGLSTFVIFLPCTDLTRTKKQVD